jgi:hypothetical protein
MTSTVPDAAVYFRLSRRRVDRLAPICLYSTFRQIGGFKWKQFEAKRLVILI